MCQLVEMRGSLHKSVLILHAYMYMYMSSLQVSTEHLEKSHIKLVEFKQLSGCSNSALQRVRCPLKRDATTSDEISRHSERERPKFITHFMYMNSGHCKFLK